MQFKTTSLTALAGAAVCLGRTIDLTPNATSRCPNAQTTKTEMLGEVKLTHFSCGETTGALPDLRAVAQANPGGSIQARTSPNFPRQFQNCQGGAADAECECAVLCGDFSFCGAAATPTQSDCQTISNTLSETPGSFFVDSGSGASLSFGSCEIAFVNEATSQLEYCFENMAGLTSATWVNCIELQGGGIGGCIADDFLWFFELLLAGSQIEVP